MVTATWFDWVTKVAARARIHRANKLKAGWELDGVGGAGNTDTTILQWLPERIQNHALMLEVFGGING